MSHVAFLAVLLLLAACGSTPAPGAPATPAAPATPPGVRDGAPSPAVAQVVPAASIVPTGDAARGEQLFAELGCKGCHGGKGEGGGIGPDLFASSWTAERQAAAKVVILRGYPDENPPMPSFEGQVDAAALAHLLAYVASR